MKKSIFKGKSIRTKVFAAATLLLIVLGFALNLVLNRLGMEKSLYIDLTPEGLYTLTDKMKEESAEILSDLDKPVKITFCSDPDTLIASQLTRVIYFMALQLQEEFENFEVETVNVNYNPTAVSKYKASSLSVIDSDDIIISYGDKYRIQQPMSFWRGTTDELSAFDGEYRLACYMKSVTAITDYAAYFTVGHGETYYDEEVAEREDNEEMRALWSLLTERGMKVKTLNLEEAGGVPEDCVLLIINNPTSDFKIDTDRQNELGYVSEIEMLDRYLVNAQGSIMVARNYASSEDGISVHPALDRFLYEWGFDFSESLVSDDENYLDDENGSYNTIIGEYDTDDTGYGYAIYGDYASLASSASTVFKNTGYITCSFTEGVVYDEPGSLSVSRRFIEFMNTYSSAKAYDKNAAGEYTELENLATDKEPLILAATTARMSIDELSGESNFSYIFCVNSPDFFSYDLLGNRSYANYDVVALLVDNLARTDRYASIELGSDSWNSSSYGGKRLLTSELSELPTYETSTGGEMLAHGISSNEIWGFTAVIMAMPIIMLGLGIYVFIRRRYL